MKNLVFASLILFNTINCLGQSMLGIKAGVTSQHLATEDYNFEGVPDYETLSLKLKDAPLGLQFGLLYHLEIGRSFFLQPEVLFSTSSYSYTLDSTNDPDLKDRVLDESFKHIDFPVQFGFAVHPLQFGGGIVPQILVDHSSEFNSIDGISRDFKRFTMAYTASIGLDLLRRIKIELRYENSEELLGQSLKAYNEKYQFDTRKSQVILSAAIMI